MYIVNKDKSQIINMDQVTALFIGSDECSIKVNFVTGQGCQVARYSSHNAAAAVIEQIGKSMNRSETFFLLDDNEVRALLEKEEKWHHVAGKKTKGHGGS